MHDSVVAVSEEAQDILVLQLAVVLYFFLHLLSVSTLDVSPRPKDLHDNLLAAILPVLCQVYLCISAFVNLFLYFEALVYHDGLALCGARAERSLLLALIYRCR